MRKVGSIFALAVALSLGGVLVQVQAAGGTPEVDNANATFSLDGSLTPVGCVGEDGVPYTTWKGSYTAGGETDLTPGSNDYTLTGPMTISGVVWTINMATGRGVFLATGKLTTPAGGPVFTATKVIAVTQGIPSAGGPPVPGRGIIGAVFTLPDEGVLPADDLLIANVEWMITPTTITGSYGDMAPFAGIPNYSVVSNVYPLPGPDGTC